MRHLYNTKQKLGELWVPILGICLVLYFGYHIFAGQRSVFELSVVGHKIEKANIELTSLTARKDALEKKVQAMRPQSIDVDLLEERAYIVLGYVQDSDLIYIED